MIEKKYTLTVTEHQLRLIAECVEDCHRFMGGQYELQNMTSRLNNCRLIQDMLRDIKPLITPAMPDYKASYGWSGSTCPNKHQRKFIAETYPIYREILHFFAVENNSNNVYSSPTLICEEGGSLPKIKAMEEWYESNKS